MNEVVDMVSVVLQKKEYLYRLTPTHIVENVCRSVCFVDLMSKLVSYVKFWWDQVMMMLGVLTSSAPGCRWAHVGSLTRSASLRTYLNVSPGLHEPQKQKTDRGSVGDMTPTLQTCIVAV